VCARSRRSGKDPADCARQRHSRNAQSDRAIHDRKCRQPGCTQAGVSSLSRGLWRGNRLDVHALKAFADWARIPEAIAKNVPIDYYPKNNVLVDRIEGIGLAMADAITFKYISAPLTPEQLATLLQVPLK